MAGFFDVLQLQGVFLPVTAIVGNPGFRLISLTGVVLGEFGVVAPVVGGLQRDCNWGSWCKHYVQ